MLEQTNRLNEPPPISFPDLLRPQGPTVEEVHWLVSATDSELPGGTYPTEISAPTAATTVSGGHGGQGGGGGGDGPQGGKDRDRKEGGDD